MMLYPFEIRITYDHLSFITEISSETMHSKYSSERVMSWRHGASFDVTADSAIGRYLSVNNASQNNTGDHSCLVDNVFDATNSTTPENKRIFFLGALQKLLRLLLSILPDWKSGETTQHFLKKNWGSNSICGTGILAADYCWVTSKELSNVWVSVT